MSAFVLIDDSGGTPTTSGQAMDPGTLSRIAAAVEIQANRDVNAHWPCAVRVRAGTSTTDVQPNEWPFRLMATSPVPSAIAYHDVDGVGVPELFDAVTLSDTLLGPGNSVAVAISHEIVETLVDQACNAWRDDNAGNSYAQEACDAVEAQSYPIDDTGVNVSNFVTPAFFTPGHAGPFDFMSTVGANASAPRGPFVTSPGGYQIERSMGTGERQVTARHSAMVPVTVSVGMTVPFGMRRAWRHGSRRARRGVAA